MAQAKGYGQPHAYNAPPARDTFIFEDDGFIPNNTLPLIVKRGAVPPSAADPAGAFEATFTKHGWTNTWRNGIFDYHHYHPNTHEVLGIAAGAGTVRFGGEGGEIVDVTAGDVVVIPAGVGHALIDASDDFLVVGAYPDEREPEFIRDDPHAICQARQRVKEVPLPGTDPVDGPSGPLAKLWR